MSDGIKEQVFEMCIGVAIHNLILLLVCLIWFRNAPALIGALTGAAIAIGLLVSIAYSAELCAGSGNENYAKKKMAGHAALRSLTVIAVIGVLWRLTSVNLLTLIFGALGMKTGAYLYPLVHKIRNHKAKTAA